MNRVTAAAVGTVLSYLRPFRALAAAPLAVPAGRRRPILGGLINDTNMQPETEELRRQPSSGTRQACWASVSRTGAHPAIPASVRSSSWISS
jgi:hypothetical protein